MPECLGDPLLEETDEERDCVTFSAGVSLPAGPEEERVILDCCVRPLLAAAEVGAIGILTAPPFATTAELAVILAADDLVDAANLWPELEALVGSGTR